MRVHFLSILFLILTLQLFSQNCPQTVGLQTENYTFNSSYTYVNASWESLLGTGVQYFLVNYKQIDSLEWNNLANLDSTSTSKIIPNLDFNTTYVWRVRSFCAENYQDAADWSVVDTFTTMTYVECPSPTNTYSDNIIVTEETGFANVNWDSMLGMGVDHFIIRFKSIDDLSWTNQDNMDSTVNSKTIGGNLDLNTFYEWNVRAFCSEDQSYFSEWSVSDTFYIGSFIPAAFTPEININLSSLICQEITDINFISEQGINEPDIQSTKLTSNLGYIELDNLELGQNVGNAIAVAGINDFINNEYSLEISEINTNENNIEIDLTLEDESQFSFTIQNMEDGGIEMSIVSPSDDNSFTSGNSLDMNLNGIFMNPSPSELNFDVIIFSELGDFHEFDTTFDISCNNSYNCIGDACIDPMDGTGSYSSLVECEKNCQTVSINENNLEFAIFPNPANSVLNLNIEGIETVKIFNISGQLIFYSENPSNALDITYLSKGLYFIEIQSEHEKMIERLIIR